MLWFSYVSSRLWHVFWVHLFPKVLYIHKNQFHKQEYFVPLLLAQVFNFPLVCPCAEVKKYLQVCVQGADHKSYTHIVYQ